MRPVYQCEISSPKPPGGDTDDVERVFSYTLLIFQDGFDFYTAQTHHRKWDSLADIDVSALELQQFEMIPREHLYPAYQTGWLIAPSSIPEDFYEKRPGMANYLERGLLNEIEAYESLRDEPNPYIGDYHGCVVYEGSVVALCLAKYHQSLLKRIYYDDRPFNAGACIQRIQDGLSRLHDRRLIHNDLNPSNIMLEEDDKPAIVGFDYCRPKSQLIGSNDFAGSVWKGDGFNLKWAVPTNDDLGVKKINEWIVDPEPFKWHVPNIKTRHQRLGHHGQLDRDWKGNRRECFGCK